MNLENAIIRFNILNKNQIDGIEPIDYGEPTYDYEITINPNDDDDTIIDCYFDNLNYNLKHGTYGGWEDGEYYVYNPAGEKIECYYNFSVERF